MEDKDKHSEHVWITAAKKRGLGDAVHVILDVLEPLAPLAAGMLWVIQPVAGIFGARSSIGELANLLDASDGVEQLRQQLNENATNDLSTSREE